MHDFVASTSMGDFLPPKCGGPAISMVLVGSSQKEKDMRMLTQRRSPALRKRPTSQPTPRDVLGQKRSPIWLGSSTKYEYITVPEIRQCMSEESEDNERLLAIERFEAAAKDHASVKRYIAAAESLEQAFLLRQKLLCPESEGVLLAAESCCCLFNFWGIQCLSAGQYTASLELLKKAEAFTDLAAVPNYQRRVSLRSVTFGNLCCYFRSRGKTNAAVRFAEKALRLEQRYKDSNDPARLRLNYAVLLSAMGRHDEAVESIEAGIALIREMKQACDGFGGCNTWPVGELDSQKRMPEQLAVELVVAHHNLWVEHSRRAMHELGASCLLRAVNVAKQDLGGDHPLTLKMEQSFTTVKNLMPVKSPSTPFDEDDLARYGIGAHSPHSPGGQLPSLTPTPQKSGTPMQLPQRPATVGGHSSQAQLPHQSLQGRAHAPKQSMAAPPSRVGRKTATEDEIVSKLAHMKGVTVPSDEDEEEHPHKEYRRSLIARRGSRSSNSTPIAPRPPSSARASQPSPRPQPRASDARFPGRANSVRGQSHGLDRSCADSAEAMQLPPRPATVAAHVARARSEDILDDDDCPWPHLVEQQARHTNGFRPGDMSADTHDTHRQVVHSSSDEEHPGPLKLQAPSAQSASRSEERPSPYWMPTPATVSATERIQTRHRREYSKQIVAEELAKDERRSRKVHSLVHARSGPSRTGIGENKRKEAWNIVHSARQVFVENGAAVRIQKCWRGFITRHTVHEEIARIAHETATQLQSLFRRYCVIQSLKKRQRAAMLIQAHWRRYSVAKRQKYMSECKVLVRRLVVGSACRTRQSNMTDAALLFQRIIRGFNTRNRLWFRDRMKTKIQKVVRGTVWRRNLGVLTNAQKTIAARWRGILLRSDMMAKHEGATRMQTLFRKYKARCWVATMQQAGRKIAASWRSYQMRAMMSHASKARFIQACFRGILTRKRMKLWRPAAQRIQRVWRLRGIRKLARIQMALAIVLQKHARRHLVNQALAEIIRVVVNCQKSCRGFYWRRHLLDLDRCVLQIQTFWRGAVARFQVKDMQEKAVHIQQTVRMGSARTRFRTCRRSAVAIRAAWVGYNTRVKLERVRNASQCIARLYRGHLCRAELYARETAATRIQHCWQHFVAEKRRQRRWDAAVKIQAMSKACIYRRRYLMFRNKGVLRIQARWRESVQRERYTTGRHLVSTLQATWRGWKGRKLCQRRLEAAAAIQRQWRRVHSLQLLVTQRAAAVCIQAHARGTCERIQLKRQRRAAIHIQRIIRGYQSRMHETKRGAAAKISAWMKGRVQRLRYLRARNAAIIIQKTWRGRLVFKHYQGCRKSLRMIIPCLRMRTVLIWRAKCAAAALRIQRCWRRKSAWLLVQHRYAAAINIQRHVRRRLVYNSMSLRDDLAIKLQSHSRRKIAQRRLVQKKRLQSMVARLKRCRDAYRLTGRMKDSACVIGSTGEMHLTANDSSIRHAAAVEIQRIVRGHLARNRVRVMNNIAPLKMQCLWRVLKAREEVERRRALAISQEYKCEFFRELKRQEEENAAVLRIQTYVRMHRAKVKYRSVVCPAVLKIQSALRMAMRKKHYQVQKLAILHSQNQVRKYFTPSMLVRREAARTIQHAFRQHRIQHQPDCNDYLRFVHAAKEIQAAWRGRQQRRFYLRKRNAASLIQAAVRKTLVRSWYRKRYAAALRIQSSMARPFLSKNKVRDRRQKLFKLQAFARRVVAQKRLRQRRSAALKIQSLYRRASKRNQLCQVQANAATRIQAYVRMWRRLPNGPAPIAHKRRAAAMKVQALVRGYFVRRHCRAQRQAARVIQRKVRVRRFRQAMGNYRWLITSVQRIWHARSVRVTTTEQFRQLQKIPGICRGGIYRTRVSPERRVAATTVQKVLRGIWCRRVLVKRARAAVVLQKQWRMYAGRKHFKQVQAAKKRLNAMIFRYRWRKEMLETVTLNMKLRRVFQKFLPHARARRVKQKILMLQRVERGRQVRNKLEERMMAASLMQAGVRRAKASTYAHRRCQALAILQASLDSMRHKLMYKKRRKQIVMLQANIRGRLVRQRVREMRQAAIDIGRISRGFMTRKWFSEAKVATSLISSVVRMWLIRMQHKRVLQAIQQIQKAWRMMMARRLVKRRMSAATRIAAAWRMCSCHYHASHRHHDHSSDHKLVNAKFVPRCGCCSYHHMRVKNAGSRIVAAVWMWRHMRRKRLVVAAATKIACVWRGFCVRTNMYHLHNSADKIRRWWRAERVYEDTIVLVLEILATKKQVRLDYMTQYAIIIQRNFRRWRRWRHGMYLVKRMVLSMQSRYRSWGAKREVAALRAYLGPDVRRLLSQLVALMPDKRGKLTRYRAFRPKERACTHVARILRVKILPPAFRADLVEVVGRIQAFVRFRQRLLKIRTCQRLARGFLARRNLRLRKQAAISLQNWWRARLWKRSWQATEIQAYKRQAVIIQAFWRGSRVRRAPPTDRNKEQEQSELKELEFLAGNVDVSGSAGQGAERKSLLPKLNVKQRSPSFRT